MGTAKIGTDANAVVDSKLRVHGLRGLRVADASVMPSIISGPGTNAALYMIGGRAAELIDNEKWLRLSNLRVRSSIEDYDVFLIAV